MISFAVEIGLWGSNKPGNSHAVNLLLYICIVISLFGLLRKYIFKEKWLSFFSTFLFAIHPIHTEVVSNIKGRDEMIGLLTILLSLHLLWKFLSTKKSIYYFLSLVLFFLALSAKENSLTFLAGIPLMLYFFSELKTKQIALYSGGFLLTTLLFIVIRNAIVPLSLSGMSDDITNNPYLFAKGMEEISTKIYVLLLYLKLCVFPSPLTNDYSYNHIPYVNINNPLVWVSLLLYALLFIYAIRGLKSKQVISFAILLFFITLSVSANIIVETGVMMAERMLFIPSIFVAMIIAVFGKKVIDLVHKTFNLNKVILVCVVVIPIFLAATNKVLTRNEEWNNDITLHLADIKKSPESARVNEGTGFAYYTLADEPGKTQRQRDSLFNLAIKHFKKAVRLHPKYNDAWINMGIAYIRLDSLFEAEASLNGARRNDSFQLRLQTVDDLIAKIFINKGVEADNRKSFDSAVFFYQKANSYLKTQDATWLLCKFNLALTYYRKGELKNARDALTQVKNVAPDYPNLLSTMQTIDHSMQEIPRE